MGYIIPWSGGMDSTWAIFDTSQKYPNDLITTVSFTFSELRYQADAELKARKNIKQWIKKYWSIKNIRHNEINVNMDGIRYENYEMNLWLPFLCLSVGNNDTILMAYLSSDGYDFFESREILVKMFNTMMKLRDIKAKLKFPYQNIKKHHIIDKLKQYDGLYKLTSYCPVPKLNGKGCGKCSKCLNVKMNESR